MSFRTSLKLAVVVGLSSAGQASTLPPTIDGNTIASQKSAITTMQLRAYAAVVVAVDKVRSDFATRAASLLPADRVILQGELDGQIEQVFTSHDLDRSRFNAIAAAIEQRPPLQRQLHQFEMDELMGT